MKVTVSEMEGMSQEELEALEDKTVAEDAVAEADGESGSTDKGANVDDNATADAEKVAADAAKAAADAADEKAIVDAAAEKAAADAATGDEDLTKHVSPPQKWIDKRLAAKAGKVAIAEADAAKTENAELKQRLEWLETQLSAKGGDAKLNPADILSPEKIEEVRKEFGDDIADMFTAVRAIQGTTPGKTEARPEDDQAGKGDSVNEAMETAISENDDLSYWQEHSSKLWDRAIKVNDEFIQGDPEYVKLSFDKRFEKVVEKVKADVVAKAKDKVPEAKGDDKLPPESLAGTGSSTTQTDSDVVDRVLAADPEEAIKIYNSLSDADKDKVDVAIEI